MLRHPKSRPASICSFKSAVILSLIGALPFTVISTKGAQAFENGRDFQWNKMKACEADATLCAKGQVHITYPSKCLYAPAPGPNANLLIRNCDAPYVISKPSPGKKEALLIPGSSRAKSNSYPVTGIESYRHTRNETSWLPNYFAFAAKFALAHYRGAANNNWVVMAMNSANRRTQDQLHIHICNLKTPGVIIPGNAPLDVWSNDTPVLGRYHVMRLSQRVTETDPRMNPFAKTFRPEVSNGPDQKDRATVALALVISPAATNYLLYSTNHDATDHDLIGATCDYR